MLDGRGQLLHMDTSCIYVYSICQPLCMATNRVHQRNKMLINLLDIQLELFYRNIQLSTQRNDISVCIHRTFRISAFTSTDNNNMQESTRVQHVACRAARVHTHTQHTYGQAIKSNLGNFIWYI